MNQLTLAERVTALEKEVMRLSKLPPNGTPPEKNWRSTLGMFAGDEVMKEIINEGLMIRESDREQSHQ